MEFNQLILVGVLSFKTGLNYFLCEVAMLPVFRVGHFNLKTSQAFNPGKNAYIRAENKWHKNASCTSNYQVKLVLIPFG